MSVTEKTAEIGFFSCYKNQLKHFKTLMQSDWYRGVFALSLTLLVPEYLAIALVFLSVIFFFRSIKSENLSVKIGRLGALLTAYICVSFFSCLYAINKMHSFLMASLWAVMLIAYFYITTVLNNRSRLRIAIQTFTVVAFICGIISIIQYTLNLFGDFNYILNIWYPLDKLIFDLILPDKLVLNWMGNRTASTFNNPNLYAMEMIIILPLGLYCLLTAQTKNARIIHSILMIVGFIGMLFSFSRGGYLSFLLMLVVFGILNFSKSRLSRWILLAICMLTAGFILIPNPFMDRLSTISFDDVSISTRLDAWYVTWDAFKEQPIGYGIGSFNVMELLKNANIQNIPHCHNIILELLAEGGILTIIIYTVMTWFVFFPNIKLHRSNDPDGSMLGATFLAIASGFLLFSMADFPMSTPKGILIFCLILAISDASGDLHNIKPLKKLTK
ncbi:MAG: hypothetical protein E7365_07570 [Clostridiales bacterium]|nr:hypothetical protein [Clostridiales bacterium]